MSKLGNELRDDINVGNVKIIKDDLGRIMFAVNTLVDAQSIDSYVFIAPVACKVLKISEVHTTAGTDTGAVSLTVKKVLDTKTITDGTSKDLLGTTKIDLKGTVDTIQSPALTVTGADLVLAIGDKLALDFTGTLTALAGGVVTIELEQQ